MKIKLLVKKIKHKIIKFLYEYFKKIYIRNINISDNEILQYAHNDIDLIYLSLDYYIQWENCFCMKDIRLEDVTPELEKKAFEEIENNK